MNRLKRVAMALLLYAVPGASFVQAADLPGVADWLTKSGVTPAFVLDSERSPTWQAAW